MKLMEVVYPCDEPMGFTDINYKCDNGRIIIRFHSDGRVWIYDTRNGAKDDGAFEVSLDGMLENLRYAK